MEIKKTLRDNEAELKAATQEVASLEAALNKARSLLRRSCASCLFGQPV